MEENNDNDENTKKIENWDDFNIKDNLLRGIYSYGFEKPSEIQKKTIQHIISGKDIIAQAQSGSGKTGAFTVGTLERIDTTNNHLQALVIAPTHELVKQITSVFTNLGSMISDLRIKTIIGGTSIQNDANELRKTSPHIVIGTAGRIYDMIKRKYLNVSTVNLFVLDEADEMLSKGFKEQIYNIFQYFHENIQVALFSATMPSEIITLTNKFLRNPVKIIMKVEELSLECIQQFYIAIMDDRSKYEMLKNLFSIKLFIVSVITL